MQTDVDWRATAGLLRAGFHASIVGHAGAVMAGMGHGPARLVALAAWGYLVYLQVRVSLDAELFTLLADGVAPAEMDGFLARAGLIGTPRERSPQDRCRGALLLWRQLMIVLAIELVAVVIALR